MILRSGVHGRNIRDTGRRRTRGPSVEQKLETLCRHGFYTPSIKVPIVTREDDGTTSIQWITKEGSGTCPH